MDNLTGYPLKDALRFVEKTGNKIINIRIIKGTNNKFNSLNNPYVVREYKNDNYVTLFVSYY